MSILSRALRGAAIVLFSTTIAACGNSEADQRKAFIGFLQDINGRAGVHVLVPTPNDEKAFGPYLQQYAIILDYYKDLKGRMDDFPAQIMKIGYGPTSSPRTVEKMEQDIETRLAKINAERSAFKQPDDLKAVYDKTFDKLVTAPTLAVEKSAKALDDGIDASIKLADYI